MTVSMLMTVRSSLVSLAMTIAVASTAGSNELNFAEIIVDAAFRVEQPVLIASLTENGGRHIVLAGRDEDHQQHLAVYPVDGTSERKPQPLLSLSPGFNLIAYDVGSFGNRDALLFIEPGRIVRYDFGADELVEVVQIHSIYGQQRTGEIAPMDFFRDVNQDGRDDLVVPDAAGYRVRLQRKDGSFGDESLLQESISMTLVDGNVLFENRTLISGDMNFDGRIDLAVWHSDSLRVYAQLADGRFQSQPQVIVLELDLPSEAELRVLQSGPGTIDQDGLIRRQIWSIADLNNDRLPDILIESTVSEGVFDKRSDLHLHLGKKDGRQLVFRKTEDSLLASNGLQFGIISTDIDGDGNMDLIARNVRLTFGRFIRALLSGNVDLQLRFFAMTTNSNYPQQASYVTRTRVRFSVSSGRLDIPAVQVADFDGDGMKDLMMQSKAGRLKFNYGVAGAGLFAADSFDIDVILPRNGDLVAAEDVDGDGRADLLIRYDAADGAGAAHRVRLLIAGPRGSQ